MEDDKSIICSSVFDGTVTGGGSTGCCRWNPTKEQISLLEGLYGQGIRTPSAEQIQEITSKLKVHGHIEGKNVFHWFQNHKARQRQKQKQDLNNNIPPPQQTFSTPVNSAYYQYPNTKVVVVPPGEVAMRRHVQADDLSSGSTAGYKPVQYRLNGTTMLHAVGGDIVNKSWKEVLGDHTTLDLFPMHPTGILDEKFNYSSTSSSSSGNSFSNNTGENNTSSSINSSSDQSCTEEGTTTSLGLHQPFFDFFADHHIIRAAATDK